MGSPGLEKKWLPGLTFWKGRGVMSLAAEFMLMARLVGSFSGHILTRQQSTYGLTVCSDTSYTIHTSTVTFFELPTDEI